MSSDTPTRTTAPTEAPTADALTPGRFPPGTIVAGRYRVVTLLGRGGMGEVYRAEDLKLRQVVALKFLPPHLQSNPGRLARFHNEVRLARAVTHANVCRVHDIGEAEGVHFLTMEYVDGEDLGSLLRRIGRLPRDKALELARQVCLGLAAAHERGVIHRDLKPANVMIDGRGRVRITDFGLAVAEEEAGGEVAGTPGYMAPEQLAGEPASVQSDLYALGLVLYQLVTGRAAFVGGSAQEVLRRQRESAPPRPSSIVPDIEPRVEAMILRCLEAQPARRPPTALSVAAALPGGDALAALVAAGETPPPEMVAAAGGSGALRPATAWGLLATVAAAVPLGLWLVGGSTLVGPIGLDKPPEVLADRSREVLGRLGYPTAERPEAFGFDYDDGRLRARDWSHAVRFWYRVGSGQDPLEPGLAAVSLDARGHLRSLRVVPTANPSPPGNAPNWAPLFAEAGLDTERFAAARASTPPPVGADTLEAWTGTDATAPEAPLAVTAAAWHGRPVFFAVAHSDELGPAEPDRRMGAFNILTLVFMLGALIFLYRNLRSGRGDREGAFRLAAVMFTASLLSWTINRYPALSVDRAWRSLGEATGHALFNAAFIWVVYLAIEPFVRRRWPESLISWSRLLAGRFGDPCVGRDILVGVAYVWTFMVAVSASEYAPRLWGHQPLILAAPDLGVCVSVRGVLAWLVDGVFRSLTFCAFMLGLLLLTRTVLRRVWAGILGVGLIVGLIVAATIPGAGWTVVLSAAAALVLLFALVARFGLLTMAVTGFAADPRFPLTPEIGSWYGRPTLALVLVTTAIALYGFVVSLGGRSPFGDSAPED